jgi:hypothetical protein
VDLAEWNADHSAAWNRFRTRVRKHYPGLEFFRGVEVQARGALHDHALVWSPEPLDGMWLRAAAMDAGFGHSSAGTRGGLRLLAPGSSAAAHYVSKYVTKASDERAAVPWAADVVDIATGEVTRGRVPGRYRNWSSSHGWGDRMSAVKARNRALAERLAAERREREDLAAWEVLADVLGPLTVLDVPPD